MAKLGTSCRLGIPTLAASAPACAGTTVTLTAGNIAAGTSFAISGPGGTFTSSPATITNAQVSAAGLYTIVATSGACSTSATATVVVEAAPATPQVTLGTLCGSGRDTLIATSLGSATYAYYTSQAATVPVGTGASFVTLVIASGSSITYYVSARSAAGCESNRAVVTAVANPLPPTTVTVSGPLTFCQGGSATLTAPAGFSYRWLGRSVSSSTRAITVIASGMYTVQVTNPTTSCSSTSAEVVVSTTPAPVRPIVTEATRCGAGAVTVSASEAASGNVYVWYAQPTGGSPLQTDASSPYTTTLSATTPFYVSIQGPSGCQSARAQVSAYIDPFPTVSLRATGTATFCEGDSVSLSATGTSGVFYTYTLNGNATTGGPGATLIARASGQYAATATTLAGCSATSATVTVTANPLANADFAYANSTICLGGLPSVQPNISGTAGGRFSVSPATGLQLDATTGVISLAGSQAGIYAVSYSVSGICPATRSQVITLTASPQATFSYGAGPLCTGSATPASVVLAQGSVSGSYQATPSGLSLDAATGAINLSTSQPGTYTVANSVPAQGTCPAALASTQVTVTATPAQPTIASTPQPGGALLLASSAASGNQWYLNGNTVSSATGVTLLVSDPANNGQYTVVSTLSGCASAASQAVTVSITATGTRSVGGLAMGIASNPAPAGLATLQRTGLRPGQAYTLEIVDALGRRLSQQTLSAKALTLSRPLELGNLPTGLYQVRMSGAGQTAAGPVLVQ